jgi:hypothetical protein
MRTGVPDNCAIFIPLKVNFSQAPLIPFTK